MPANAITCYRNTGAANIAGINYQGQLGNNKHSSSETPVRVVGGDTFLALATSGSGPHSCATALKRAGQGEVPLLHSMSARGPDLIIRKGTSISLLLQAKNLPPPCLLEQLWAV